MRHELDSEQHWKKRRRLTVLWPRGHHKLARNYDSSLAQKAAIFDCPVALNIYE